MDEVLVMHCCSSLSLDVLFYGEGEERRGALPPSPSPSQITKGEARARATPGHATHDTPRPPPAFTWTDRRR